jgi:GxxExxY protein
VTDLIHGELSYRLMGILYKIYNTIGSGFQEKYYQRAIKNVLTKERIPHLEQVRMDMCLNGANIGRYYIDFVIENKIVLEIKTSSIFSKRDIKQVLGYLKKSGIELGILASFTSDGVKFKRILKGYK